MNPQTESKKKWCVHDWRDLTEDYYRLPSDGRQWRSQAILRMRLLDFLTSFANSDGSHITVGVERMSDKLGRDTRTVHRLLDDLVELRALVRKGLTSEHGTAVRDLTLDAFLARFDADMESDYQRFEQIRQSHNLSVGQAVVQESTADLTKSRIRYDKVMSADLTKSQADVTNSAPVCRTTTIHHTDHQIQTTNTNHQSG